MGLKFRRGSTAQQSGSLAFGEPYVNTTLGTLIIGGATGDIVLSAGGTGSTGNFGPISGSGLDITGNANIAGNLTLGGAITIGDASADTVNVIASLSSSLIPQTSNAFDLGSADKIWRDLYISTGSIKFVEGTTVVKTLSPSTLTALESKTGSYASTGSNSFSGTQTITGSINVKDSAATFSIVGNGFSETYLQSNGAMLLQAGGFGVQIKSNNLAVDNNLTVGGYVSGEIRANNGVVSGSSQITYASISSIPAGIVSGSTQVTPLLPTGVVSGSAQTIANLPAGTVSGSSQVIGILSSLNTYTGSNDTTNASQNTSITNLNTTTASLNTSVSNLNAASSSYETKGRSIVSGSSQITLSATTGGTTSSNVQFNSLGIGMAASATTGRIDATNDIVAFSSSDIRFKENITPIENALDKIRKISGNTYDWKEENKIEHGYEGNDVGVIAQEIEAVLPQLVQTRENGYKAVKYDKLVALLIEGIKEQQLQIEQLRIDLNNSINKGL